jgi:hypothetical protein
MRRLSPPTFDEAEVYSACAGDVPGVQYAKAYASAAAAMMVRADEYRLQATSGSLHTLPACSWGNDDQIVVGTLTKGDLKKLYEKGMLGGESGRTFYDRLLLSAPLGKCPYCRFGHAETLDHFLSKSRYPSYAVLPSNLIPACMRCNKGKGGGVLAAKEEMSHPYFEVQQVELDDWLVAEVMETSPVTAKYSVAIPAHWPVDLSLRVTNYFAGFNLAVRYSVEAASELVSVSAYLRALPTPSLRREHLQRVAVEERGISRNGWKTALYAALASSHWYSNFGYSLVGVP